MQQIVANDQRDGLNDRDRTRGFAALALDGMSVAAIAKATGHKRDTVDNTATTFGHDESALTCTLVGQDAPAYGARLSPAPNKPVHAIVALAFASVERGTDVHTWRARGDDATVVAYLRQIAAWGYPLSDVERIAAGIEVELPTEA